MHRQDIAANGASDYVRSEYVRWKKRSAAALPGSREAGSARVCAIAGGVAAKRGAGSVIVLSRYLNVPVSQRREIMRPIAKPAAAPMPTACQGFSRM